MSTTTPETFDDFLQALEPRQVTHPIVTDDDAMTAYRSALRDLEDGRRRRVPAKELAALVRAVRATEEAVRAKTLVFRLQALPKDEYKRLRAEHPPTEEDNADLAEATDGALTKAQFHADTFGPALLAACLVKPAVANADQAKALIGRLNEAQWSGLFSAAINVNQAATSVEGLVFS